MLNSAATHEVKIIVAHAKQVGMSKDELAMELARYRNTAMYIHNIQREDYTAYVKELVKSY